MKKKYICPICKELNEEHRSYCKECGTWLLNTNFPATQVSKHLPSNQIQGRKKGTIKTLYTIGITAFFVLLLPIFLDSTEDKWSYFFSIVFLVGLAGFVISLILILIILFTTKLQLAKKEVGKLLGISFLSIVIGMNLMDTEAPVSLQTMSSISFNSSSESIPDRVISSIKHNLPGAEFNVDGIILGDSIDTVKSKFGVPVEKVEWIDSQNVPHLFYYYPQMFFDFVDNKVSLVGSSDIEYKTKKGIGINSTLTTLVYTYEKEGLFYANSPNIQDSRSNFYFLKEPNHFIMFYLSNDQVSNVIMLKNEYYLDSYVDVLARYFKDVVPTRDTMLNYSYKVSQSEEENRKAEEAMNEKFFNDKFSEFQENQ